MLHDKEFITNFTIQFFIMKKINILLGIAAVSIIAFGFIKTSYSGNTTIATATGSVGTNIGDMAPELSYKNPDGKEIALSSLKGSYVLIDFWASWCGPCRMENPNVVKCYNAYKNAKFKDAKGGFKIYSVSLDKNADAWKGAIAKDQLIWPDHVSDLMGWQSQAAAKYGVDAIPTNYLINAKGVILAKGLRGPALEAELSKYVSQ